MQADAVKVESVRKGFQNDASKLNQRFAFLCDLIVVLVGISLMTNSVVYLFLCLLTFPVSWRLASQAGGLAQQPVFVQPEN